MFSDTYNSLIAAFGTHFHSFSSKELVRFCEGLSRAGLRQSDIYSSVVDKLSSLADSDNRSHATFQFGYMPLFRAIIDVGL